MRKISADLIYPISSPPITNGTLIITDEGEITDVLHSTNTPADSEYYKGALCPGFINTHCHLELSHLKGCIPQKTGLVDFILDIQKFRQSNTDEILEEAEKADLLMWNNGIVAVGDISNGTDSFSIKRKSPIHYHTFIELLGFNPEHAEKIMDKGRSILAEAKGLRASLSPHAPYSVSDKLFELILKEPVSANNRLYTIHNQEDRSENLFFQTGEGDFNRLYETFGIDISFFSPPHTTSLRSYMGKLNPEYKMLLVHNVFTNSFEMAAVQTKTHQAFWCLCPGANLYIGEQLPPVNELIRQKCKITLGTDSLASNHTLNILSEVQLIRDQYPEIPMNEILKWATYNGAEFLGIEDTFGSFEKGKKPGINIIGEGSSITKLI